MMKTEEIINNYIEAKKSLNDLFDLGNFGEIIFMLDECWFYDQGGFSCTRRYEHNNMVSIWDASIIEEIYPEKDGYVLADVNFHDMECLCLFKTENRVEKKNDLHQIISEYSKVPSQA